MEIDRGVEDLSPIGVLVRGVELPLYPTGTRPKGKGMGESFILSAGADIGKASHLCLGRF